MTEINPEIHTTKFVNIDDKSHDIYINKQLARHFEPGEEAIIPIFVAKLGAKHLINRILQEKHDIRASLHTDPLRKELLARIIPDLRDEVKEVSKPLSDEEFRKQVLESQKKQEETIAKLTGEIETLKKESKPEEKPQVEKPKEKVAQK